MTDPADLKNLRQAISHQEGVLGQQGRALREITDALRDLTTSVAALQQQLLPPATEASASPTSLPAATAASHQPDREPWVPAPERYDGNLGQCRSFLFQCDLVFAQQPEHTPRKNRRSPT